MSTRPEYTKNTSTANSHLDVRVPPGWYVTFSAISRETYNQVVKFKYDIDSTRFNTYYFGSYVGKPSTRRPSGPTPMKNRQNNFDTHSITAQQRQKTLNLSFYHSTNTSLDPSQVATSNNNWSHSIDVLQVDKPDTAAETIPDYTMLMIFVQDARDERNPGNGMYGHAVATIHLVKKKVNPNRNEDDDDSDS